MLPVCELLLVLLQHPAFQRSSVEMCCIRGAPAVGTTTAPAFRLPPSGFRTNVLCAASGEHLDAGAVLAALPGALPLGQAAATLAALLAGRQHAARQGAVVRSLRKAAHLAAASTRAEVQLYLQHIPFTLLSSEDHSEPRPWNLVPRLLSLAGSGTAAYGLQTDVCCVRATQLLGRRVAMSAERSCQACHNRIGDKMFAVYPSGVTVRWPTAGA
jgi:Vacuolar sorting protein 39 domain 2